MLSLFWSSVTFSQDSILVFAASSMTHALNQIIQQYQNETGQSVKVSYGASSALARQLAYGAPADIYISAHAKWMDYAVTQQSIESNRVTPWLKNQLVLIAPIANHQPFDWTQRNLDDLLNKGRLAIGDPAHVPAGIYAKEALESLKLWQGLQGKMALSHNVRSVLILVERHEANLGIVYRSDVLNSSTHIVQTFPETTHQPIVFVKAITRHGENKKNVMRFYDFLSSPIANHILSKLGFTLIIPNQLEDKGMRK